MRPQLRPLALALALLAAVPPRAQAGSEVTTEAGSTVNLSCNLTGPSLSWRWVPRYPRCAGVSSGIQTIYTATATGAHDTPEGRFQERLHPPMDQGTRLFLLKLQTLHMNDSGAFICASPSQAALPISVTVMPGPRPTPLLPLVGGCVGAALGLVLVGAVAVICCRRRRARDASVTPMVTEMDRKSEQAAEQPGPTAPGRAEQKPPSSAPHPDGEGPEGISYSTLHFQGSCEAGARTETGPATIYSELAPGHG
ncbi:megakaryocyte and platelet inhibitory receptor G6b-like isoform X2 [Gopherus evgoodei]|uniref:megakaryocyte and platelet inhibitory receptor G6b-like isoform X2 n=1 Tax=Gopherus evgoodei TaxID=1825980 RepID=UPI0011CFC1AC|nr:megakaryocyte and platelet inhibitory receptor G6b-like isoform X2 [Gopherus evgoodei]